MNRALSNIKLREAGASIKASGQPIEGETAVVYSASIERTRSIDEKRADDSYKHRMGWWILKTQDW